MGKWAAALKGVLPNASRWYGAEKPLNGAANEPATSAEPNEREAVSETARALAPVVWLLGKVGSGKTSIIRAITHSTDAEIGDGFRPCTRTARIYEFPTEAPVLRFLDTRGLGEAGYDPGDDIAFSAQNAHLVIATMRAMDAEQEAVVEVLRRVRRRHPEWPIVVAQTSLHEAYKPGETHTLPYPFDAKAPLAAINSIPIDLMRGLAFQRSLLEDLPGREGPIFVPVDLTHAGDGFTPVDYGLEELTEALACAAPSGMMAALNAMPGFTADPRARSADPIIMGHSMAAAGGDLVPIPVAGAVAVTTVQARLLNQLGRLYGIEWDRRAYTELSAALGAGTLARMASSMGLRQLAKFVPVYGQTAGAAASAAASFAVTYALGKAAAYYLHRRRTGASDQKGIAHVYQEALRNAFRMARERRAGDARHEAGS
jgi:uncharacterized protein (DUF697 family)